MAGPLPLNALNAFVVAARHLSFSKAADDLHVTPAAVSQQIRSLEESLGVQLFHRLNRGLALTDAGQAGLAGLQTGFENIQQAVERMKAGSASSELNIWTAPSFASKWLMPRMHRFIESNSSVDLRISGSAALIDSNSTAPSLSAETLKAHNIDIAIRFGSGNYPGCEVRRLMDVVAIPLCSPELLRADAGLPLRKPADLCQHTLLHDESPYEGRPHWASWFGLAGLAGEVAKHNLYFNSVSLALSAAISGQGVVLTLEQLAQHDMNKGLLVPVFDRSMEVSHAYHLVTLPNASEDHRVSAFIRWLFEECHASINSPVL